MLLVTLAAAAIAPAWAQPQARPPAAQYQMGGDAYAGVPFVVGIVTEGLAESPEPKPPAITVAGATVSSMGVEFRPPPTFIINGQRVDQGTGTWVMRYRVETAKGGTYTLPDVTVTQGSTSVVARGARLTVADLPDTKDMAIEVVLPTRPVYVGETIAAEIHWYLRQDPRDQTLSVPILSMTDQLAVTVPPPRNPREVVSFPAGGRDIQIGFRQDTATRGGVEYTRLTFPVLITPHRAGSLVIPPAQVVAQLETGVGRDRYGFPTARMGLFRAADEARTLDVRPLPETGKPPSFGGAVGASFSIAVRASRSVVQLGEPVELEIAVKSDQRLDGVGLPPLDGPGLLPRSQFVVPADPPVGELSDDGLTKTFRVAVQVVGADATAVPALAFSYFDPVRTTYQTIHSEPIALSVKGGSVVGSAQVVGGGQGNGTAGGVQAAAPRPGEASLAGVELALSPSSADGAPLSRGMLWLLVGLLYAVPLGLFGLRTWRLRTAGRREQAGEVKTALRALRDEIERMHRAPAKEAAVSLPRALRTCARALGRPVDEALIERIENAGFAPGAGADPLSSELRHEVNDLADAWSRAPRPGGGAGAAALLIVLATVAAPRLAHADEAIRAGRADYQSALDATDPQIRQRNFAAAAAVFAKAARTSRSAALHTDWGNAALGAGDVGGAALAYRRALVLDRSDERARRNLAWLRGRMPDGMRPSAGSATQTLFFFHSAWSRDRRLVAGAVAFAAMMLMLVPWGGSRRRGVMAGALVPALVWGAMTISLLVEDRHSDDAVVMQSVVLRVADRNGAPPKLATPLPAGVEVVVIEHRDDWERIELPSGETGWLPGSALERVSP